MMVNFPRYFKDYLEYTNLNEEQFFEIVDKFRPDHLWEKKVMTSDLLLTGN